MKYIQKSRLDRMDDGYLLASVGYTRTTATEVALSLGLEANMANSVGRRLTKLYEAGLLHKVRHEGGRFYVNNVIF
jgi:hypothetical protein